MKISDEFKLMISKVYLDLAEKFPGLNTKTFQKLRDLRRRQRKGSEDLFKNP